MTDEEKTVIISLRPPERDASQEDVNLDEVIRPIEEFFPRIREDLIATPGKGDTVIVRVPENPTGFPIYKLEWQIAQLMDGSRSVSDISMQATRCLSGHADRRLHRILTADLPLHHPPTRARTLLRGAPQA